MSNLDSSDNSNLEEPPENSVQEKQDNSSAEKEGLSHCDGTDGLQHACIGSRAR